MDKLFVVMLLIGLFYLLLNGDEWAKGFESANKTVETTGILQNKESNQSLKKQTEKSKHAFSEKYKAAPPETVKPYYLTPSGNSAIDILHMINYSNHEAKEINAFVDSENKVTGRNVLTLSEAMEYYSSNRQSIQLEGQRALNPYWRRLITSSIYY